MGASKIYKEGHGAWGGGNGVALKQNSATKISC